MSLMLNSKKSTRATYEELASISLPEQTDTYKPVGHAEVVDLIRQQIDDLGLEIKSEAFGLSVPRKAGSSNVNYGDRMFGQITVKSDFGGANYSIAFRNSYDQSMALGIASGATVIVCDNMCLSGRWLRKRKHTSGIDAEEVISNGFSGIQEEWAAFRRKLDYLKSEGFTDGDAAKAILTSVASNVIPETLAADVWKEWVTPSHDEFKRDSSAWRLYMAYTEANKLSKTFELQGQRSCDITGFLLQYIGVDGKELQQGSNLFVPEVQQLTFPGLADARTEAQVIAAGAELLQV